MNSRRNILLTTLLLGLTLVTGTVAQAQTSGTPQSLREKLEQSIEVASQNQLQIVSMERTPLSNIFLVELSTGEVLYADISGDYLFTGDMYRTTATGLMNLTSGKRQVRVQEKIAAVDESEMIVFMPEQDVKEVVTVFTDVDCTFCRRLHSDLEEILGLGIEVRYMAYPRGGESADSYAKMVSVWCSEDRQKSLTQAKNGQNLPARDCDTPIMEHHALGNELGLQGTPMVVAADGRIMPGYGGIDYLLNFLNME